MKQVYVDEFEQVAISAFGMWNRDPASPSFGSFDRQYWGWKYRDFSDATLQYAVKLAVEYAIMQGKTSTVPALLDGFVSYCRRIQLKDGSFNQCYPFERTPGVFYDILSALNYVRNSPYITSQKSRDDLDGIIERGFRFAFRTDEKHGAIANHVAHFAHELIGYSYATGDAKARQRGLVYLEKCTGLFDDAEGWFQEYHGPDAGYQTRTLRFLVKIALLLDDSSLWAMINKAAAFVGDVLMPDGSIHPMVGSRSTALLYPSAFETLASIDEQYQGLASRVRQAWVEYKVPMPRWLDFGNAIRLADDALDAARALATNSRAAIASPDLPGNDADFARAGIIIRREPDRAVYIAHKLGGVVVVYVRGSDGAWKLAYEDSGYMLRSRDTKQTYLTRVPDAGRLIESAPGCVKVQAGLFRSSHGDVTPLLLLLLRTLNLTVLRLQWVGDLFRRLVVRRLAGRGKTAPVLLLREIAITKETVSITDSFRAEDHLHEDYLHGELFRCRRITGIHMASSRYFQAQELEQLPLEWIQALPMVLGGSQDVVEIHTKS